MIVPIKSLDMEFFDDEVFLGLKLHHEWNFDKLKFDNNDHDYILYLTDSELHVQRFWLKTLVSDLKNKQIIFKDVAYGLNSVNFWFNF